MSLWDKSSGMSKPEWRATCVRTMNGTELTLNDLPQLNDVNHIIGDNVKSRANIRQASHVSKPARHVAHKAENKQTASSGTPHRHGGLQRAAELTNY